MTQDLNALILELSVKLEAAKANPPAMLFLRGELVEVIIEHLKDLQRELSPMCTCAKCTGTTDPDELYTSE